MFTSKGFHGTATAAIAQRSGVSNGTLFHHFRSKEELIQKLHTSLKSEQLSFISSGMEEEDIPRDKIQHVWQRSIQWAMDNRDKYHFLQQYKYSPYRKKAKVEILHFNKEFMDNAEKGVQQKQVRYLPYDYILDITNAHVHGMIEYLSENPIKYRTPEFMRQAFDSFYDSIKP